MISPRETPPKRQSYATVAVSPADLRLVVQQNLWQTTALAFLLVLLTSTLLCRPAAAASLADPRQMENAGESSHPDNIDINSASSRYDIFDANRAFEDTSTGIEQFQKSSTTIITIASSNPDKAHPEKAQVHVRGKQPQRLVMPQYPSKAIQLGIEGYVVVHFDINADGTVATPRVLEAQPSRTFDKAALDAVKQFHYTPQAIAGNGIAVKGVINKFVFQLSDHEPTGYKPIKPFNGPTRLVSL